MHSDCITKVVSEPDQGIYDAMNKGLDVSTGDIVGILNSDDLFYDDKVLSDVCGIFLKHPEIDCVFCDVQVVDAGNTSKVVRYYRSRSFRLWMFRFGVMPPHPGAFIRRHVYENVGLFRTRYSIAADFDFLVRAILLSGHSYLTLNRVVAKQRMGGISNSQGWISKWKITTEMRESLIENGIYSNVLFLLFRLPFKFFSQMIFKSPSAVKMLRIVDHFGS